MIKVEFSFKHYILLKLFSFIEDYSYTYKSMHKRTNNSDLDLYTCAFNFNELIELKNEPILSK